MQGNYSLQLTITSIIMHSTANTCYTANMSRIHTRTHSLQLDVNMDRPAG